MNIPSKIARSNYLQAEKVQEHQAAASKYYKQYSKLRKRSGEGETLAEGLISLKTSSRKPSLNNRSNNSTPLALKEEIISWFFSLDLISKLIISSIENKWVTNLLHQLYINQKYQPSMRFQIKEGELINVAMPSKETEYTASVLRVGLVDNSRESLYNNYNNYNNYGNYSNNYNNYSNADYFNYLQYFINKEEYHSNSSLNNFCGVSPQKIQEDFLNELKFYKSEDLILNDLNFERVNKYCNYFTLSEKILQDEKLFRYYFDKLSCDQAFLNLIPSSYDNNSKHHSIYLPEWIKNKEYYTAAEIFLAFFEQVITVKYIIHKQYPNQFRLSSHLEQLMKERDESILYLKKTKKNAKEIIEQIKNKKIIDNIFSDSNINTCVMNKLYQGNPHIYFTLTSFTFEDTVFDKENLKPWEIERKLEKFLFNVGYDQGVEKFIDKLMYFNIDKIYSFDDFLFRAIFEFVCELRQKESFEALMNDDLLEELINGTVASNTNANLNASSHHGSQPNKSNNKRKKKKKATSAANNVNNININSNNNINTQTNPTNSIEEIPLLNDNTGKTEYQSINSNSNDTTSQIENTAKEEKRYAFSFIKRKPENLSSNSAAETNLDASDINNTISNINDNNNDNKNDYENKDFLGDVMLIKKKPVGKINAYVYTSNNSNIKAEKIEDTPDIASNSAKEGGIVKDNVKDHEEEENTYKLLEEAKDNIEEIVSNKNNCSKSTIETTVDQKDVKLIAKKHNKPHNKAKKKYEIKSEIKSENKQDNIQDTKSENKKDNNPDYKQDNKIENKQDDRQDNNPDYKQEISSDYYPEIKTEFTQEYKQESKLDIINEYIPDNKPEKASKEEANDAKEEHNDTDTAYSSEGNNTAAPVSQCFENPKKKKKEKNKFFLYNVNKAPKKNSTSTTAAASNTNSNTISNSLSSNLSSPQVSTTNSKEVTNPIAKPKLKENNTPINPSASSITNNILSNQTNKNVLNKVNKPSSPSNSYSNNINNYTSSNRNSNINSTNNYYSLNPLSKSANNTQEKVNANVFVTNTNKIFKNEKNDFKTDFKNDFKNEENLGNTSLQSNSTTSTTFFTKRHNSANDQYISDNLHQFPNPQNANLDPTLGVSSGKFSNTIHNDFRDLKFNSKRKYSTGNNAGSYTSYNSYNPHTNYSSYTNTNNHHQHRFRKEPVNVNVNVYNVSNIQNFTNYNYSYNPTFNSTFNPSFPPVMYNPLFASSNPHPHDFFLTHNPMSFEFFQFKLHKDMLDYCEQTERLLLQLKPFKASIILHLETMIKQFLLDEFRLSCQLEVYGSFASEMDIEVSDIDVTINLQDIGDALDLDYAFIMKKLVEKFNNVKIFESVNPIYTASVPVIKLQVDPEKILEDSLREKYLMFKNGESFKNYKFDSSEINLVKIDLTFCEDIRKKNRNVNVSQKHVELIKNSCLVFPELKPLIKILKRFLSSNKLNCTFNGGLSSFCLFILALATVKMHRLNFASNNVVNLGKLLIEFLLYYGSFLDFNFTCIDVNLDNPFVVCPEALESVPTILDPITYNNAGKSSYKISNIKQVFNYGYEYLNEIKSLCEKNKIDAAENIVYLLLSKRGNASNNSISVDSTGNGNFNM